MTRFFLVSSDLERSPIRFGPDADIWHSFKQLTECRGDLGVAHEFLQSFEVVPRVDGQELRWVVGIEVRPVPDGTHGTGHHRQAAVLYAAHAVPDPRALPDI